MKTALVALTLALPAAAIPVLNGDFESGDFHGWTRDGDPYFTYVDTDVNFGATLAHSGTYGAYLGPIQFQGSIAQDLATTPGTTYEISYWLANLSEDENIFIVEFGGTTLQYLYNSSSFAYTRFTFTAVATAATTPLIFTFKNVPETWTLDDITVEEPGSAPELQAGGFLPATLFTSLLLGILTSRRRATKPELPQPPSKRKGGGAGMAPTTILRPKSDPCRTRA